MQAGYFSTVWNDIKSSPGWFGRLCLLGLLNFIPVFGQLVLFGYAFGWARDAAWKLKTPMPARIFGNEDGRLYSRGFHILVISFVAGLIPRLVEEVWSAFAGNGVGVAAGYAFGSGAGGTVSGLLMAVVFLALSFFCSLFGYAGSIRSAVYCRLSPGFQIKRLWSMIRFDTKGLLRVWLTTFVIAVIIIVAVYAVVLFAVMVFGLGSVGTSFANAAGVSGAAVLPLMLAFCLLLIAALYFLMVGVAFVCVVQARALGYWVSQFDVPSWRGQDDPMPFETTGPAV